MTVYRPVDNWLELSLHFFFLVGQSFGPKRTIDKLELSQFFRFPVEQLEEFSEP